MSADFRKIKSKQFVNDVNKELNKHLNQLILATDINVELLTKYKQYVNMITTIYKIMEKELGLLVKEINGVFNSFNNFYDIYLTEEKSLTISQTNKFNLTNNIDVDLHIKTRNKVITFIIDIFVDRVNNHSVAIYRFSRELSNGSDLIHPYIFNCKPGLLSINTFRELNLLEVEFLTKEETSVRLEKMFKHLQKQIHKKLMVELGIAKRNATNWFLSNKI